MQPLAPNVLRAGTALAQVPPAALLALLVQRAGTALAQAPPAALLAWPVQRVITVLAAIHPLTAMGLAQLECILQVALLRVCLALQERMDWDLTHHLPALEAVLLESFLLAAPPLVLRARQESTAWVVEHPLPVVGSVLWGSTAGQAQLRAALLSCAQPDSSAPPRQSRQHAHLEVFVLRALLLSCLALAGFSALPLL
jgi:hypothetical protein